MKTVSKFVRNGLILSTILLLTSCSGGGGSGETGHVSISITDNQALYNSVVFSIEAIGIVASNSPTTYFNSNDSGALPVTIDILDLPGEATLYLGDIEVPLPGNGDEICFHQIRLVLADDGNYLIENDDPLFTQHPLKTPSGQQSGVKILSKEEEFCLSTGDDAVSISLDFDPETAIVVKESSTNPYQFKPTSIRIIEGEFFTAPQSFITGLTAIPTYNTAGICEELAVSPLVTVAAYNSTTLAAQTVALTEGPFGDDEACQQWCGDDADCLNTCSLADDNFCYYTGPFKLLLPQKQNYDISATWDNLSAEALNVSYNSTILLELME